MPDSSAIAAARIRPRFLIKPGQRIRVLVVDDSVVIRRAVSHALAQDQTLEIVGSAANGAIALERIPQLSPDVVTLDVEMPEMNGLETLRELRRSHPNLIVIMFSTLTERGASTTLDALLLGANDYVTKPSNTGSLDRSLELVREQLIPKIRQFFQFEEQIATRMRPMQVSPVPSLCAATSIRPRSIVCIGVSTGGPRALAEVIPAFPPDFPLPIVIVQHMPPVFTRLLAERLQANSRLDVVEAQQGMTVAPGKVIIAPGDYHMRVVRSAGQIVVSLDQSPPENSCRPAVDVLFRSVCDLYSGAVISVILTGMGQDGLRGIEQLKSCGAYVIAQDEPSSVVWGMPGAVAQAGLADSILSLKAVVPEILRRVA
jgi:two-component system chemotaxis response regulator CheB